MWGTTPKLASIVFEIWQLCLQRTVSLSLSLSLPTRCLEWNSRHRVKGRQGFLRLETRPISFRLSKYFVGSSGGGFVCHPTHKPAIQVCELETRSRGGSDTRFHSGLVSNKGLCLSPLEYSGAMPVPFKGTEFRNAESGSTYMGKSATEPCFTTAQCRFPSVSPSGPRDSQQGGISTPPPPPPAPTSRMACPSQRYSPMEISSQAKDLLSAWRNQTSGSYESAWSLWHSLCDQQQIDPLFASVHDVVNYLASKFTGGKEFRIFYVTRSAISKTHPKLDGISVGQHPLVCQVMKGIFQKKSPLPKYSSSWDVSLLISSP